MNEDPTLPGQERTEQEIKLPLIEEQLRVSRERVSTGAVRVSIAQEEQVQRLRLQTFEDEASVERVRVERTVDHAVPPWEEGDVLVIPVYEEEVVVQRRLVLKEEVRIQRRRNVRTEEEEVKLTRQRATVERRESGGGWAPQDTPAESSDRDIEAAHSRRESPSGTTGEK
jgi:uncharacterized protein (TIGR02271 family)